MKCDMCGSIGKLYRAIIEDAELNVCHECSKFGKVIGVIEQKVSKPSVKAAPEAEKMDIIIDDYAEKIRKKRESLSLTQKEFAKKVNEKNL